MARYAPVETHRVGPERHSVWLRGLSWIEAHREHFALSSATPDLDDLFPLKVLAELARVADVLARGSRLPADVGARVADLLRFAWEQYGEGELFATLLEARPRAQCTRAVGDGRSGRAGPRPRLGLAPDGPALLLGGGSAVPAQMAEPPARCGHTLRLRGL